ncbi:MAG TPA: hypothetical protein DIT98_19615 [Verrucomicrobiales bacterium]|nr:hypothetical protein [Verrucomicrobiales bacterium]
MKLDDSPRPHSTLHKQSKKPFLKLLSKKLNHPTNPGKDFIATIVCSDADEILKSFSANGIEFNKLNEVQFDTIQHPRSLVL